MGQRLNIEIFNNGQVVANAYYHWSAYTRSALELTAKVISAYNDMPLSSDEKEIAQKIPYESLPWWQLLIHLVGYHEEIDVLLSEYQYFNPLF